MFDVIIRILRRDSRHAHCTIFNPVLKPWEGDYATFLPVLACTRLSVSTDEQKKRASISPSPLSPRTVFPVFCVCVFFFRSVVPAIMEPETGYAIPVHSRCCRVQRQTPYSRNGIEKLAKVRIFIHLLQCTSF